MPGPRARSRARATLAGVLRAVSALDGLDAVDVALDRHALETLERLALDTMAYVRHARGALGQGRVRLGVLPFDSPAQARMLLPVLRESGARSLLIQHGFAGRLGDPDMSLTDHVAIWSERDRSLAGSRASDAITVTGNPGVCHLAGLAQSRKASAELSVVLVDYPSRLSARVDSRISMRHVATALRALASARPGSPVVVRPHPSDRASDAYARLAADSPELQVKVDVTSPIETLLAGADMCVGAVSTATLQACAIGVPTVFLDVSGITRPWPFHASELPLAVDTDSLVEAIALAQRSEEIAGRDQAVDALGVRPDALERVIELMGELLR
jgi:hypothetical protein